MKVCAEITVYNLKKDILINWLQFIRISFFTSAQTFIFLFGKNYSSHLTIFFIFRGNSTQDKRAHHNALERKRRDHIKDSFTGLRDAIPTMRGGDKSSRAQILKKASEYIQVDFNFEIIWLFKIKCYIYIIL